MARRWNSVFTVNDQNPVPHLHPIPVQEPGCGARHSLQRCRKQGAVHGLRVQRCRVLQSGSHFVIVCRDSGTRIDES